MMAYMWEIWRTNYGGYGGFGGCRGSWLAWLTNYGALVGLAAILHSISLNRVLQGPGVNFRALFSGVLEKAMAA